MNLLVQQALTSRLLAETEKFTKRVSFLELLLEINWSELPIDTLVAVSDLGDITAWREELKKGKYIAHHFAGLSDSVYHPFMIFEDQRASGTEPKTLTFKYCIPVNFIEDLK
jgi:hypothetical protein